jgi:PKD repeat protein
MLRFYTLFFCMLLKSFFLQAQLETAQWRIGYHCGLDFQFGSPITVSLVPTVNAGSPASMSDSLGNLLFYSRGDLVYNKLNDTMANGLNIGGEDWSPQSCVAVRKSGSRYYVIYNAQTYYNSTNQSMLGYAELDMSLAGGLGSVTATSRSVIPVGAHVSCKMAVTRDCDGGHWLLVHGNEYLAYHLDGAGVNTLGVVSSIGAVQTPTPMGGFLFRGIHKFSPNGRKVAAAMPFRGVEIYDFDRNTGVLSNMIRLDSLTVIPPNSGNNLYDPQTRGVEFSPDGSKLYVTYLLQHPYLCQFDLCAGSPGAIKSSKVTIDSDTLGANPYSKTLQLAPDGKIYVTRVDTSWLACISNPNGAGLSCNYVKHAVWKAPGNYDVFASLPNFESTYFEQKPALPPVTSTTICGGAQFNAPVLCAGAGYSVTAYQWDFGDPLSGASNTVASPNPLHYFSGNGDYAVKLVLQYPCGADTLRDMVHISGLPQFSVSAKQKICLNENVTFSLSGASSYSLNAASTSQSTLVMQPTVTTVYTVTAADAGSGCVSKKQLTVSVVPCTGVYDAGRQDIVIYPNPSRGLFTIESPVGPTSLEVCNAAGQLILTSASGGGTRQLKLEPAGIYFLKITGPGVLLYRKLVVTGE